MKRKRFSALLGSVLALVMLLSLMVPLANAHEVSIVFYNPLAELEPIDNLPVASRAPLRNKIANGEEINLLVMFYGGKPFGANLGIAIGDLMRDEFIKQNPALAGKVSITLTTGGTSLYTEIPASTSAAVGADDVVGTDNNSRFYWKNTGQINPDTGLREPRPPYFGNPWGPKTGYGYTGYPSYEENFERYAAWASYDAVILSAAD